MKEIARLIAWLVIWKKVKFVTVELLKTGDETVKNSKTDKNCGTKNKQKSLNLTQDQQEKSPTTTE